MPQDPMHEGFCCTIFVDEYFEPETHIQVALIDRQVFVPGKPEKPTREECRLLRIGDVVYVLEPPQTQPKALDR